MQSFNTVLQPKYYSKFQCVASNCIETCCAGWGNVVIEEATYNYYKEIQDLELQEKCRTYIVKDSEFNETKRYKPYAFIKLENGQCPFLTSNKLCQIQKKIGEHALSLTCDTYPRNFNKVNGILQRSLDISCPEAAKFILLNREGIQFEEIQAETRVRHNLQPEIDGRKMIGSKAYQHFNFIQKIVIQILQNRMYSIDERLMILSMFCEKLEALTEIELSDQDFIDHLLALKSEIEHEELESIIKESRQDINTQFEAMNILLNHSLKGTYTVAFGSCVEAFKAGLEMSENISLEQVIEIYKRNNDSYYRKTIDEHMYILENYLVNTIFKDLFPVGAQINVSFDEYSIRRIHMILVIKYTLLRTILIGMSGHYKEEFNISHIIKALQSFEKNIGHNLIYLKQAVNFMDAAQIQGIQGCLLLLKI